MPRLPSASPLALGTSRLRSANGGLSREDAVALLRGVKDLGINCFDTANIYGQGDAERALGEAFSGCRDEVVLATKVGYAMPSGAGAARRLKPLLRKAVKIGPVDRLAHRVRGRAGGTRDQSSGTLLSAVHASLARLGTDHVDVLYLHNPGLPAASGQADVLAEALSSGLCRQAGVAVANREEVAAWRATGLVTVFQVPAGIESVVELVDLTGRDTETVVGREVFSGGNIFDPEWVASHASDRLLELNLDTSSPGTYAHSLAASGLIDHVLIGTTNLEHARAIATGVS